MSFKHNTVSINLLLIAGLLCSFSTLSFAQEGQFGTINPEFGVVEKYRDSDETNPEEALIKKEEEAPAKEAPRPKKIVKKTESKPETSKSSSGSTGYNNPEKENESVLSFNFLYYMIQKFKFTEVVDQ